MKIKSGQIYRHINQNQLVMIHDCTDLKQIVGYFSTDFHPGTRVKSEIFSERLWTHFNEEIINFSYFLLKPDRIRVGQVWEGCDIGYESPVWKERIRWRIDSVSNTYTYGIVVSNNFIYRIHPSWFGSKYTRRVDDMRSLNMRIISETFECDLAICKNSKQYLPLSNGDFECAACKNSYVGEIKSKTH